ncbi:hypothetical protein [Sediminicoccus sp. KRV36]|uniref:hypothetical protein n=1 Tax=Sediminicoccus sp. KRV36 TaxID=3133721 RepID=UPI00200FEA7A|nr:hypothetical protein [Sediminicoccus rosea]UPY35375.1 hypothetical protein LHU95_14205 [Sediminicoccus rosea]
MLAISSDVKKIISVETDPAWIAKLLEEKLVSAAVDSKILNLMHADIGQTGKWGHPILPYDIEKIRKYPMTPWEVAGPAVDLVLIDGRFRAACLAASLLSTQETCRFALHDVSASRPSYLAALELLDVQEQVNTLVIGTRRKHLPTEAIQEALTKFSLIPA